MGFEKVYITNAGLELEAKSRTGKTINILRVEIGDGELTDNNITGKTALIHKILECEVNSLKEIDNQTIINFILQQSEVDEGFYFREFGIIAEDPDSEEEILYMYANAGNKAEFINDKTSTPVNDRIIDIVVKTDNTDNISISINNTGVYVESKEYQAKMLELTGLINKKANKKKVWEFTVQKSSWGVREKDNLANGNNITLYGVAVELEGLSNTDIVHLELIQKANVPFAQKEIESFNKIFRCLADDDFLELICIDEYPDVPLKMRVEVMY